jgi:hypothetical protein
MGRWKERTIETANPPLSVSSPRLPRPTVPSDRARAAAPREKRSAIFGKVRENRSFKGVVGAKVEKCGVDIAECCAASREKPVFSASNVVEVDPLAFRTVGGSRSKSSLPGYRNGQR